MAMDQLLKLPWRHDGRRAQARQEIGRLHVIENEIGVDTNFVVRKSLGYSRNDMVLALHHTARIGARRDVTEVDVAR
jgi:hypothetical protein